MARIVVVGGGVLGTMHAREAIRRGHNVLQIDSDVEPRKASVRNFGLVWVSGRAAGAEVELALRSRELWEDVAIDAPGVKFRPHGSLTLALTSVEAKVMEEAATMADAAPRQTTFVGSTRPCAARCWVVCGASVTPSLNLPACFQRSAHTWNQPDATTSCPGAPSLMSTRVK
jgi:glycine/D-amino acid oxidase-like deaminating enzyme